MTARRTKTDRFAETARSRVRVFLTKSFARSARKDELADEDLCVAVRDLEQGLGDDLGGNVWKKRVDKNRARAILATKPGEFWVFVYLFSKSNRQNIEFDELVGFRKLAQSYAIAGGAGMERLLLDGKVKEICNELEDEIEAADDEGGFRRAKAVPCCSARAAQAKERRHGLHHGSRKRP